MIAVSFDVRWDAPRKSGSQYDSLVEEGGFEPSVPFAKRAGLFSGTGIACIVRRPRPTEDKRADRLGVFCTSMM